MKRSCPNFSCSKYNKICISCVGVGVLCMPTCNDCKDKKTYTRNRRNEINM